jgi:hypothetical protein
VLAQARKLEWAAPSAWWREQTRARRRNCGGGLLRKMREHGGRIEDAVMVFDELPAAGEAKPSLRIVSHQTSDFRKHAGGASHSDGSKSEIGMIEFIGILNVKVIGGKRRTPDAEDGRWPRRVDANSLAREMHEERRAGRKGGGYSAANLEGVAARVCRPCFSGTRA